MRIFPVGQKLRPRMSTLKTLALPHALKRSGLAHRSPVFREHLRLSGVLALAWNALGPSTRPLSTEKAGMKVTLWTPLSLK